MAERVLPSQRGSPARRDLVGEKENKRDEYSRRLAEKVKAQAQELREQAEDLEHLVHYKTLCEERLRSLDPGITLPLQGTPSRNAGGEARGRPATNILTPRSAACGQCQLHMAAVNKVEQRAVAAEEKAASTHRSNLELRTLLEKRSKELALAQLKLGKLADNLKAYEQAKQGSDEYAQELEAKLLGSQQGSSIARGAKAIKRLKMLEKDNSAMRAIAAAQESEIEGLQKGVLELRHALHTEAKRLGLAGADALLELTQMREAVAEGRVQEQKAAEEAAELRRKLQEADVREEGLRTAQAEWEEAKPRWATLTATSERLEADNAALLEYIQELTDERNTKEREVAELRLEVERLGGAKAAIEAAQSAVAAKDSQLEQVYQQLKEARGEVVRIRGERLEDSARMDRAVVEAQASAKRQMEALDGDKAALQTKITELRATIGRLDEERQKAKDVVRAELEADFEQRRQQVESERTLLSASNTVELQRARAEQEARVKAAQAETHAADKRCRAAEEAVAGLKEEVEAMQERKSLLEMRLRMLEDEQIDTAATATRQMELQDEVAQGRAEVERLRSELVVMQSEAKQTMVSLEADLEAWKSKAKHAQDRYAEFEATVSMSQEDARRRVATAEGQVASLQQIVRTQAEEVSDARRRLAAGVMSSSSDAGAIVGREKALMTMVDDLQQRLQITESELAKQICVHESDAIHAALEEKRRLREETERLGEDLQSAQRRARQLQAEADEARGVLQGGGMPLQPGSGLVEALRTLIAQHAQHQSEVEALRARVPVLEAEVENVTRQARAEATARTSEELAGRAEVERVYGVLREAGIEVSGGLPAVIGDLLTYKGKLDVAQARVERLREELSSLQTAQAGLTELRRHHNELSEAARLLEAELASARAEGEADKALLAEMTDSLAAEAVKAEEAKKEAESAQGTLSERDVEIRRLRKLIRPGVGIPLTPPAGDPPTHRYTSLSADRPSGPAAATAGMQRYKQLATEGLRGGNSKIGGGGGGNSSSLMTMGGTVDGSTRRRLLGTFAADEDSSDDDVEYRTTTARGRVSSTQSALLNQARGRPNPATPRRRQ